MMKGSMIYTKGLEEQIESLRIQLLDIKKQKQDSDSEMYKKAYWVLKAHLEKSKKDLPEHIKELLELEV